MRLTTVSGWEKWSAIVRLTYRQKIRNDRNKLRICPWSCQAVDGRDKGSSFTNENINPVLWRLDNGHV